MSGLDSLKHREVRIYFAESEVKRYGEGVDCKLIRDTPNFLKLKTSAVNKSYVLLIVPAPDDFEGEFSDPLRKQRACYEFTKPDHVQIYFAESEIVRHGEGLEGQITNDSEQFIRLKNATAMNKPSPTYDDVFVNKKYIFQIVSKDE